MFTSQASWLDTQSTQGDGGLFEGQDEDDALIFESKAKDNYYCNGCVKRINDYTDDNKWVKGMKNYNNAYIAFAFWTVGIVMLWFAFCELPFLPLFPKAFLRNMSIGSSCVYIGFAIYSSKK